MEDHNVAPHLEMPRDHPPVVQHSRYQLQSWRANGDVSLILSNSAPDNPSTDDIITIIDYVDMLAKIANLLVQLLISLRTW